MKLTPEELREAYARGTSTGTGEHPSPEALSRLLQGASPAEERERIVDHVAACARCAEELRVARPVGDGLSNAGASVIRPAAWWPRAVLLAAAACVVVAGGLALRVNRSRGAPDAPFRAPGGAGLRSLLPSDARLPRSAALLRWAGAPTEASFDVVLANERLDVLARIPGVREEQLRVPLSVLDALPPGTKLVWSVTTVLPDGTRADTRTFANTVE